MTEVQRSSVTQAKLTFFKTNFRVPLHGKQKAKYHLGKRTVSDISYVTEEMVQYEIKKLNMNKSCGPDDIHPRLLIELSSKISKPIA